jgi:hypothetical protein
METMMIIMLVLVMLLLMELMIIININYKNKLLINKLVEEEKSNVAYVKKQFDLLKENGKLKTKNENLKIIIDEQEQKINKLRKSFIDYSDSKINELETKYTSALQKIIERDQKNRDLCIKIESLIADEKHFNKAYVGLDNEVNHLQNCIDEKEAIIKLRDSQIIELEKTNKKYSQRVYELHGEKDFAIHQSRSCIKLCDSMSIKFKAINSELESIESELNSKLNP